MQNKNINIIAGVAVVLAVIFGVSYLKPTTVQNMVNVPPQEQAQHTQSNYGAVSSLDGVDYPYVSIGGQREFHKTYQFSATSSIPVIIPNPFGATSTIIYIRSEITKGITGANTFDISTTSSSTGYGSSTPALIYAHSVATGAQDYVVWSPNGLSSTTPTINGAQVLLNTAIDGTSGFVLKKNESLTLRFATSSAGTFAGGYLIGTVDVVIRR